MTGPALILVAPAESDSISDCACAAHTWPGHVWMLGAAGDAPVQRAQDLVFVPVDEEHQVVFHPRRMTGTIVINRFSGRILDFLPAPGR